MAADPLMKETLCDHVFNSYVEGKEADWDEYRTRVSSWGMSRWPVTQ